VATPANAVSLSALFIFGQIFDEDIVGNGGTLPVDDVPANRLVNNISSTIGFQNFVIFPSGNPTNTVESIVAVEAIITEPVINVELLDFNISGHNGDTSDKAKLIGVIPSEELTTDARSGQLNYYAHFPIMIDLNLEEDKIVYDLTATLRLPNGEIIRDLNNPTSITLLFKESEETKQKRMMKELTDNIISATANRNQAQIDQIGRNNPVL